jgi:hypothetical protein
MAEMNDVASNTDEIESEPAQVKVALAAAAYTAANELMSALAHQSDRGVITLDVDFLGGIPPLLRALAARRLAPITDGQGVYVKRHELPDIGPMREAAALARPLSDHLLRHSTAGDGSGVSISADTLHAVAMLLDRMADDIGDWAEQMDKLDRTMFENDAPLI